MQSLEHPRGAPPHPAQFALRTTATLLLAALPILGATSMAEARWRMPLPEGPTPNRLNEGLAAKQQAYSPDGAEAFMQTWNAYYRSDDGHHIFANVAISHLGIGSTCGLNLAITTPDGRTLLETEQLDGEDELKASKSAVQLRCGHTSMRGSPRKLRIQGRLETLGLDVTVEQGPPGVDTDTLWLDEDRDLFARYNVPHLGSRMKGRLRYDGAWHEIGGFGAVEHFVTNHGLEKFSKLWHRVRLMEDGVSLMLGGFTPTEDYERGVYFLFLAEGDRVVAVTNRVKIEPIRRIKHASSGYQVPSGIRVTVDDPRLQLEATIERTDLIGEFDVLQQLNPVFRLIVRTFFANPWIFRNRSRIDVSWRVGKGPMRKHRAEAMHEIIFVNE